MGLKLKVRNFLEQIPTFVEVTGKKLVGEEAFAPPPPPPPSLIGLMEGNEELSTVNIQKRVF